MEWNIEADLKKVGKNLRRIRTARDLSIDTVAREIERLPEILERLEAGKCPECTLDMLFDLVKYYDVTMEEILGRSR